MQPHHGGKVVVLVDETTQSRDVWYISAMGSLSARATAFVAGCGGLLLAPSLAFADVAPKCGCSMNSAGAGVGWLVLGGLTALIILRRRRGDQ